MDLFSIVVLVYVLIVLIVLFVCAVMKMRFVPSKDIIVDCDV